MEKKILSLDELVVYTGYKKNYVYQLVFNRIIPPFQHIGILSLEFHVDKLSRPLL